jgi:hypothetical protein
VALEQRHGKLAPVGLRRCTVHAMFNPEADPRAPAAGILGRR